MRFSKFTLILLASLSFEHVWAITPTPEEDPLTRRLWLFGGVDLGYSLLNTSVDGEENKSGIGGNLKFLASRYWDKWVFDGGFGFGYKNISGKRPTGFVGNLETRTLLIEMGARHRFTPKFEGGLFIVAHTLADVSHRPTEQPLLINEPEKKLIFMTGLQGLYTLSNGTNPIRVGLRLGTDLDIPHRRLFEIQGVFQIGFGLGSTAPPPAPPAKEEPKAEYFEIPFLRIYFKLDSDELTPESVTYLERLGKFLHQNLDKFTRIEVEGHTDHSGGYVYNIDLSQRRAERVGDIISKQGVPKAILLAKGYGYNKPLFKEGDPQDEKNRRVLVRLLGASEEKKAFIEELKAITR